MTGFAWGDSAVIFAASCTGLQRLAGEIGRPLILVDAVQDLPAAIDRLNKTAHGCARRWPDPFQSLRVESGWTDWRQFDLSVERRPLLPDPLGICMASGSIVVPLPEGVPLSEFRAALQGVLRHLRLQEVTIAPSFLAERSARFPDVVVHPRYTPVARDNFDGATLVTDFYALDPAESCWRLFWSAVAARAAAGDGSMPRWR